MKMGSNMSLGQKKRLRKERLNIKPIDHYTRSEGTAFRGPGRTIKIEKVIQDDWAAKRNEETFGTLEETSNGERRSGK